MKYIKLFENFFITENKSENADVNLKDSQGKTSLHYAIEKNDLEEVMSLVEKGADVNLKDNAGKNSLHFAMKDPEIDIIKFLVEKGADVNLKSRSGKTSLQYAIEKKEIDITKFLVEKGADVNLKGSEGKTPLHCAIEKAENSFWTGAVNFETIELLIQRGANINAQDIIGRTALHYSIGIGPNDMQPEITKFLVEKGADIFIRNTSGETPLEVAKKNLRDFFPTPPQSSNISKFAKWVSLNNLIEFLENAE